MNRILLLLSVVFTISCHVVSQCNGAFSLCSKPFNEVAYLTTHNAFNSSQYNFSLPNQNLDITGQLAIGVRAFMLDVTHQVFASQVHLNEWNLNCYSLQSGVYLIHSGSISVKLYKE